MNRVRRLRVLMPTLSTGVLRVSQLLVLLVIVHTTAGPQRSMLVVGFGLIGSFTMLTDSGAANFILSGEAETRVRAVVARAIRFHVGTTGAGMIAAAGLTAVSGGTALLTVWPVFAALAVTQLLDSTSRIVRSPQMAAGRDLRYSLPDVALVAVKLPLLGLAWATGSAAVLVLLVVPSLVQVTVAWIDCRRFLTADGAVAPRLRLRIAEFGITGAVSAFYAQVPLLVAAALWAPAVVAPISVAYRVVQAFDLLPATASLQLIPRVRAGAVRMGRVWLVFIAATCALGVMLVSAKPLIDVVLHGVVPDTLLFATVVLAFVPRSGNFVLNAAAMGSGRIRARLVATVLTAAAALGLVPLVARTAGPNLFGLSSFAIESLFSVLVLVLMARGVGVPFSERLSRWRIRAAN